MCGFVGFWQPEGFFKEFALAIGESMGQRIAHRGPDDSGIWFDEEAGIVLTHRRLAIIDLSQAGHQPMVSACGRFILVFNGEIYNHRELRAELEKLGGAPAWRGYSDTETLLAALVHWGVEEALIRLNGMFAFALWDRRERQLWLARDRMGEKPLYYGCSGGVFLFGSELKALKAHPAWRGEIDRNALTLFLRHNYIPAPWSIYKGIWKLLPGHYVLVRNGGQDIGEPRCYWDIREVAETGIRDPLPDGPELVDLLETRLQESVASRMEADVPLGAFLSGGIDSSTVVALMQAQSSQPVRTFSIGFHEADFNEAEHAKAVARHLGTDHTELYVTPQDALNAVPHLPEIWDEPFADSSQIPTLLLSQLTRRHVTVALSGDGGDELFGGYNRYFLARRLWRWVNFFPLVVRRALATVIHSMPFSSLTALNDRPPDLCRAFGFGARLQRVAEILDMPNAEALYYRLVSHWKEPAKVVTGACEPLTILSNRAAWPELPDFVDRMMWLDQVSYLPDDILVKVDRASMAVSLEARVPLVDHRLVEFAWRVPRSAKIRDGQGKWLLRKVLYRYLPQDLVNRPKQGFGVPIEHWLRGPLRDWAEALLDEKRLREEGFFNPVPIRRLWTEHLSGRRWHYYLWSVLMFQAWLESLSN